MLKLHSFQLDRWFVPRSRAILLTLIAANLALFMLVAVDEQPLPVHTLALAQDPPADVAVDDASSADVAPDVFEPAPADQASMDATPFAAQAVDVDSADTVSGDAQATSEIPMLTTVAEADDKPIRECRIWGPAQTQDEFASLATRLEEQGGFPEIRQSQIQGAPDYMIYIANLGSLEKAKRTGQELMSVDIDSYVIDRSDDGPILSVGVFSREELATNLYNRLTGLGYDVVSQRLERNQTVFNLIAHVQVASDDYQTSVSACHSIAQGK